MAFYYSSWYTWWWVWVVFFVVILAISVCSYCCRRRYVNQQAVVVRAPQPVQCTVSSVNVPMYAPPGQPGAPPGTYPYPEAYQYPTQMAGYPPPPASTGPMSPPYPASTGPMSPPYPATPMGPPQYNIPGYSSVPPPYESVGKQ